MKVVQARALSEPILVLSPCDVMDLIAVATASALAVYRSGSLAPPLLTVPLTTSSAAAAAAAVLGVPTCMAWSPLGRVLSVGFATPQLLLVRVETSDVVRHFAAAAADAGAPPRFLASLPPSQWALRDGVAACGWTATPLPAQLALCGTRDCLPLAPAVVSRLPMLDETWHSCSNAAAAAAGGGGAIAASKSSKDNVSALVAVGRCGTVSVLLGGLQEVWRAPLAAWPASLPPLRSATTAISQCLVVATASPESPLDVLMCVRSSGVGSFAPVVQDSVVRLRLGTSAHTAIASPIPFTRCVLAEYVDAARRAFAAIVAEWTALARRTLADAGLPKHAALLCDLLVATVARPDAAALQTFVASLSLVALARATEATRALLQALFHRAVEECARPLDFALAAAQRLVQAEQQRRLSADNSGNDDDDDGEDESGDSGDNHRPSGAALLAAIAALRRAVDDLLPQLRAEAEGVALLLRWLVQLARAVAPDGGVAAAESVRSAIAWVPIATRQQPQVLELLQRVAVAAATAPESAPLPLSDVFPSTVAVMPALDIEFGLAHHRSSGGKKSRSSVAVAASVADWPSSLKATGWSRLISLERKADDSGAAADAGGGGGGAGTVVALSLSVVPDSGMRLIAASEWRSEPNAFALAIGPTPVETPPAAAIAAAQPPASGGDSAGVVCHAGAGEQRHVVAQPTVGPNGKPAVALLLVAEDGSPVMPDDDDDDDDDDDGGEDEDGGGGGDAGEPPAAAAKSPFVVIEGMDATAGSRFALAVSSGRGFGVVSVAQRFAVFELPD